ncbi:MAG TPA: DUF4231 domain-containing protein [Terriglobales bacterium]|jgi:hypothetical protein|nr:DUF4231 domain-containing protein [Terriglobales bacterium]
MLATSTSTELKVGADDYPALFLAADSASLGAQRQHLWFTGAVLLSLVAAAGLGALSAVISTFKTSFAVASTALVSLSFVITAIRRALKPEKLWYGGRAVAESAKSMAWRYMTGAEPYFVSAADVDAKFVTDLRSLVKGSDFAVGFSSEYADKPQISPRMREVRACQLEDRKYIYLAQRISDQRAWYGRKARKSQQAESWYFVVILVSQALALASGAYMIASPSSKWNLVGVFSSLASALLAWLQVRQHEELAQSYAVAALDLGFIEEQSAHVGNDQDFSSFVGDAENAISREHTLWIARRDRS